MVKYSFRPLHLAPYSVYSLFRLLCQNGGSHPDRRERFSLY